LDPGAEIFQHRFSPIIILTTSRARRRDLARLRSLADDVKIAGHDEVDWVEALAWLRQRWGVRRLLCEGGGELNAGLFRQGVVDEVYLTLAPLVFGGRGAPTMADGTGIADINDATRLRLISLKRLRDELFLVYRVRKHARRLNLRAETASETSE
jgi:riboflavin-specific deaminase-like protein